MRFALNEAREAIQDASTPDGVLPDLELRDQRNGVLVQVRTELLDHGDGLDRISETRKWFSAETQPGEKARATLLVVPGYGQGFSSIGVTEQALEAMRDTFPTGNLCVVGMAPAGRWTEEAVKNQTRLAGVSFAEMRREYSALAESAILKHPKWFTGKNVLMGHSLGGLYAKGVAQTFLNESVNLAGFINANGVGGDLLPGADLQFLWNVREQLFGTIWRALTQSGPTILSDEEYENLMGLATPDSRLNRNCSPLEFLEWALNLRRLFPDFEQRMKAHGVRLVTMTSEKDHLIPPRMTRQLLRGQEDCIFQIPGAPHALEMDLAPEAQVVWQDAIRYAFNGGRNQ